MEKEELEYRQQQLREGLEKDIPELKGIVKLDTGSKYVRMLAEYQCKTIREGCSYMLIDTNPSNDDKSPNIILSTSDEKLRELDERPYMEKCTELFLSNKDRHQLAKEANVNCMQVTAEEMQEIFGKENLTTSEQSFNDWVERTRKEDGKIHIQRVIYDYMIKHKRVPDYLGYNEQGKYVGLEDI